MRYCCIARPLHNGNMKVSFRMIVKICIYIIDQQYFILMTRIIVLSFVAKLLANYAIYRKKYLTERENVEILVY